MISSNITEAKERASTMVFSDSIFSKLKNEKSNLDNVKTRLKFYKDSYTSVDEILVDDIVGEGFIDEKSIERVIKHILREKGVRKITELYPEDQMSVLEHIIKARESAY